MSVLKTARNHHEEALLTAFTNGVKPDALLFRQEIKVQQAWAAGLCGLGVISPKEFEAIKAALKKAAELMEENKFDWREEDEDIHMNLERFVNEETDHLGKKMHLGRSRNDLIATTLKLHVADNLLEARLALGELILTLTKLAENFSDVLVPGMTHQQNGQPVRWAHALLGHAWALQRDRVRFSQTAESALATMPLGSAALAGTSLAIDLAKMAQELGFKSPPVNSYDAVGDRDGIAQALQNYALLGAHLSRLAEDCIYWASAPVGLIKLPPAWSTGSSIMPNKRNPDVAELTRGKASLWIGDATGVLALMKGLATSYSSDLHEAKIPYLRVCVDVTRTIQVLNHFVDGLKPIPEKASELLKNGHILATEIADHLAAKGVPFREAYQQVAALVELAEKNQLQVHELAERDALSLAPNVEKGFVASLSFERAVEKRNNHGGTARSSVHDQIAQLRKLI